MDKAGIISLLGDIAIALAPIILAVVGFCGKKLADLIQEKTKNEFLRGVLGRLDNLCF
jgi:hypothetical protein